MGRRSALVAVAALVAMAGCDRNDGRDNLFTTEPMPTTTVALAPATTTTAPHGVQLRTDGLGAVAFGRPAAQAEERLTEALGEPDERLGPYDAAGSSPWGLCPGDRVRGLRWGRFTVLLTTGATDVSQDGAEHFSAWWFGWPPSEHSTPTLATDTGVTIGSTVAQLRAAYGDGMRVFDDELVGPAFEVGDIDEYPYRLFGGLSATADDGVVNNVGAGVLCGE